MAAVMDVVLQCRVCRQKYFLLDDYYKHQCADNNNNVSGKWFFLPIGEICINISECS